MSSEDAVKANEGRAAVVVHHLDNSRSQRILWLLEELQVPYEIKEYKRGDDRRAPSELKTVHPLGKSPVITDGDLVIAESGAIVEYIIAKFGKEHHKVKPTDVGWVDNIYYTHYAEGTLMPILVNKLIFSLIPPRVPFLIRPLANTIFSKLTQMLCDEPLKTHIKLIEEHLSKSKSVWFAGGNEPTSADFLMMFPMFGLQARGSAVSKKIDAYVAHIKDRPAYKKAIEKGGEITLSL